MNAIVISVSSDIGTALCQRWLARGWTVAGTHRTPSPESERLAHTLLQCDLRDPQSIYNACARIKICACPWNVLVICSGVLDPIGPFGECDAYAWESSVHSNLLGPARLLRHLLPFRDTSGGKTPTVIFFAGAGTNSAPANYSAYVVSKVALIKLCEILDAEIPDTKFTILGPGWVKTKIHQQTLAAGARAGDGYQRTVRMFQEGRWVPMERVLDCVDWVIAAPREVVGGRNFSVLHDAWGPEFEDAIRQASDLYKLRREPW